LSDDSSPHPLVRPSLLLRKIKTEMACEMLQGTTMYTDHICRYPLRPVCFLERLTVKLTSLTTCRSRTMSSTCGHNCANCQVGTLDNPIRNGGLPHSQGDIPDNLSLAWNVSTTRDGDDANRRVGTVDDSSGLVRIAMQEIALQELMHDAMGTSSIDDKGFECASRVNAEILILGS
jgi:hypothetical protein